MSYYIRKIATELFYLLTVMLVVFSVMELVWNRIVLAYINVNWVLILWTINVMVLLILTKENE